MTETTADAVSRPATEAAASGGRDRLVTLEIGRFVAAASVMLGHYTGVVEKALDASIFQNLFGILHVGVPYFFVLSGFVMYHVHAKDIGVPSKLMMFVKRRAIRLLPMFWLISATMLAGFLLVPSLQQERSLSPWGIVADFLLLPHANAVLSISWTLRHEAAFYMLFALMIWLGHRALWLVVAWITSSLALDVFGPAQDGAATLGAWSVIASPLNLGFGLGMAVAIHAKRRTLANPGRLACMSGIMMIAMLVLEWTFTRDSAQSQTGFGTPGTLVYLGLSALLIRGLVALEATWDVPAAGLWKLLGGASYLLYLLHQPLASLALRIVKPLAKLPPELVFLLLSAAALLCAVLLHVCVERRILGWLSGRRSARPSRPVT